MLVPFEINYDLVKKFNLDIDDVEFHRMRILKVIDDIRYEAIKSNLELTGESLSDIKKLELLKMFEPKLNTQTSKLESFNQMVICYDISYDYFIEEFYKIYNYFKKINIKIKGKPFNVISMNERTLDFELPFSFKDIIDMTYVISNVAGDAFGFFISDKPFDNYKTYISPLVQDSIPKNLIINSTDIYKNMTYYNDFSLGITANREFSPMSNVTLYQYTDNYIDYMSDSFSFIKSSMTSTTTRKKLDSLYFSNIDEVELPYNRNKTYKANYIYAGKKKYAENATVYYFDKNVATVPDYIKVKTVIGYIATNKMINSYLSIYEIIDKIKYFKTAPIKNDENKNYEFLIYPFFISDERYEYATNLKNGSIYVKGFEHDQSSADKNWNRIFEQVEYPEGYKYVQDMKTEKGIQFFGKVSYPYEITFTNNKRYKIHSLNSSTKPELSLDLFSINPLNSNFSRKNLVIGFSAATNDFQTESNEPVSELLKDSTSNNTALTYENIYSNEYQIGPKSLPVGLDLFSRTVFKYNRKNIDNIMFFPTSILINTYRVRNSFLWANPTSLYSLEQVTFPKSLLDKTSKLLQLSRATEDLKIDIKNNSFIQAVQFIKGEFVRFYDSSIEGYHQYNFQTNGTYKYSRSEKNVNVYRMTSDKEGLIPFWFIKLNESEVIFFDATPSPHESLWLMELDKIELWQSINDETTAILVELKNKADAKFNEYYVQYLTGEAVEAGEEAVKEFEYKKENGIFYVQNGVEYWRAYTEDEKKLIEKIKSDAEKMLKKGEITKEQNKEIIARNQVKMTEAKEIAKSKLKEVADKELAKIKLPSVSELIEDARQNGGFPTDALKRWTEKYPKYFIREDLNKGAIELLNKLTILEQKVATAKASDLVSEIQITNTLKEIFNIKES